MNKKKLFLKLILIVAIISSAFLLSSCLTTLSFLSCRRNCQEACQRDTDSNNVAGNEYGIYYSPSADGESYLVTEVGYKETSVKIPETYDGKPVTGIRRGAFTHYRYSSGCGGGDLFGMTLTSLTLPSTINYIEYGVFSFDESYYSNCGRCDRLYFEGTLEDWLNIEFGCSPFTDTTEFYIGGKLVTNAEIPESITRIPQYAFAYYSGLKSVTFHENVAIIEDDAFYRCYNIGELVFPCTDLTIGQCSFSDCYNVESITFTGEKVVLGNYAFSFCTGLKEVNWNTVRLTSIPEFAFLECSALEAFVIPSSVIIIRNNAFSGCYNLIEVYNLSDLNVVAGSSANGGVAYYAGAVYTSEEEESSILTVGDYKFTVSEAVNTLFKYTGEGGALNLPTLDSGKPYVIGNSVFKYNESILSVNIPECVTAIGDNAFFGCKNLKIVSGCKGVLTVGVKAFVGCVNLESAELAVVEEIGNFAFSGCSAFNAVTLPQSVIKIGTAAFDGTANISYAGTLEEWLEVELSKDASETVRITCSDEVWEGEI